jgi:hypothetical protein
MRYPTQSISGMSYVPGRLTDHPGTMPVLIRSPRRCDHTETVCTECVTEWQWDWTLVFDRTVGGRKLASAIA